MRTLICAAAVAAIAFAATQDAHAQAEPGQGYISFMGSYIDNDDSTLDDDFKGGQFSLGYAFNERWNIEGLIHLAGANTKDGLLDEEHKGFGIDAQRIFRRSEKLSPYLLAGFGYFERSRGGIDNDGSMGALGVGVYYDLFDDMSLRGEFKRRKEWASSVHRTDSIISIGIHLPLGYAAPKWVDSDGDGVEDSSDRCPNTPAGVSVDSFGCELDSDGDGVKDSQDQCPGTPRGVSVDANGCPNDSDGDGVSDDMDECPGTPAGAEVDAKGCELDDDGDGVVNRLDECPGTAAGVQVDIKGCEIKEEIRLEGVNFETNSDRLLPGAENILDDAAATLQKNPSIKVEVAGHTDSDGSAAYNESLSSRRAQTVHDYLASNGIGEDRMTVRGYGESQPIADNSTAAGKAQNRRVVLRITAR